VEKARTKKKLMFVLEITPLAREHCDYQDELLSVTVRSETVRVVVIQRGIWGNVELKVGCTSGKDMSKDRSRAGILMQG
jgi:hypothetical protein